MSIFISFKLVVNFVVITEICDKTPPTCAKSDSVLCSNVVLKTKRFPLTILSLLSLVLYLFRLEHLVRCWTIHDERRPCMLPFWVCYSVVSVLCNFCQAAYEYAAMVIWLCINTVFLSQELLLLKAMGFSSTYVCCLKLWWLFNTLALL